MSSADINYFDFSRVPETLRPFYYGQAVGAINRYMRDPYRDVRRRTLLMLDEFHYITRTEAVARMAAEIAKVARKYGIAVVAADQNPATFLGNTWGQFIWENCSAKVLFHLDDAAARRVGEAISDLDARASRFSVPCTGWRSADDLWQRRVCCAGRDESQGNACICRELSYVRADEPSGRWKRATPDTLRCG